MAEKMNIYQRMLAATSEISRVAKNLNVGYGQTSYKATGEADVLAAVKPIEEKYGIYSYPYSRKIIDSGEMVSVKEIKGEKKEARQMYLRMEIIYRFVNIDNPTEYIDITTFGDGLDSQDKAPGKAMTYGDKYALLKAYKIMTGDDPDQNASGDLKGYQRKETKPEPLPEKEQIVLKELVTKAGLELASTFPNGIEYMTAEQYREACIKLNGLIEKKKAKA